MVNLIVHIGPPPKNGKKYLVRCREIATYDLNKYILVLVNRLAKEGHFGGYKNLTVSLIPRVASNSIVMNSIFLEIGGGDRQTDLDALINAWKNMGITVSLKTLTVQQYKDLWRAYLSATPVVQNKRS